MRFVENAGVRIHYKVDGVGETVVLQHGFSDSLETWSEYHYVDALREGHQVVSIDARGHGLSDKPHDPDQYRLESLVGDVTAVLDDLGVEKAHFVGVSMGGRYGFGLAKHAPDRLLSLMIGAIPPWRNMDRTVAFIAFLEQGAEAFIPVWETQGTVSEALKARLRANDANALVAMVRSRLEVDDDVADSLLGLPCPYKLIVGDQDNVAPFAEVAEYAAHLPAGSLITLPGINHLELMQRVDLVMPHIRALIERSRQASD